MKLLLNYHDYQFYKIDDKYYKNYALITNIGIFVEYNNEDKKKDITHIKYIHDIKECNLFLSPLINLKFLQLEHINDLNKINIYLHPNLKILILNIREIENKILCDLPIDIEILVFKSTYSNFYHSFNYIFSFDNLPTNLKKIIFHYDFMYTLENTTEYQKQQKIIINKIKKCKVPFKCKIYFCLGDDIHYIEKSQFDE